jgi:hypothetical protein
VTTAAAASARGNVAGVATTPGALRPLVGATVEYLAAGVRGRGVLLSVAGRSAWLVVDGVDEVLPLDDLSEVVLARGEP